MSLIEQLKYQFKSGGTYLKIIYINIGVFLFLLILNVFAALMKFGNFIDLTSYLELSSSPYTFLIKPWTLLTYMFVHLSIGHIFWNMILYFFAGRIFEDILGKKAALKTYLIGGSFAGLLHIITYNIFPLYRDLPESPVIGASGAVMAIFVGLATYTPNYEAHFFGVLKIKLKYLAIGFVILDILGKKAALKTYLIGGSVAGLLHIITYNIFPLYRDLPESPVIGASGAVMAIFVGLATYTPNYEAHFFGVLKIKLKYLAIGFVILDILGVANTGDRVAHFAHIGGAVWGFLYASNIKKGKDISSWITVPLNAFISVFKKKKIKIVYKSTKKKKQQPKTTSSDIKIRQEKVDAILDKIKASGYDSLTKDEKDYLFNASKNI